MGRLCGRCRLSGHNRATCKTELDENGNPIGGLPPNEPAGSANATSLHPIAPYPRPSAVAPYHPRGHAASYHQAPPHVQPFQHPQYTASPHESGPHMGSRYAPYPAPPRYPVHTPPHRHGAEQHQPYHHSTPPAGRLPSDGPSLPHRTASPAHIPGSTPASHHGRSVSPTPHSYYPPPPQRQVVYDGSVAPPGMHSPSHATPVPQSSTPHHRVKKPKLPKRQRPWRSAASADTRARITRALSQRMYLVDRERKTDIEEVFTVLGTTGNVYHATVGELLNCTCPDFAKKNNCCKHMLFVMLKVLKLPSDSQYIYQVALLPDELQDIFAQAPPDPRDVVVCVLATANEKVRTTYKQLQGGASAAEDYSRSRTPNAKPVEGDCPICYDEMTAGDAVVTCKTCGNHIHGGCFREWEKSCRGRVCEVTCVLCRSDWTVHYNSSEQYRKGDGYTNLGQLQGMPSHRDTSTYYSHWGRSYADDYDDADEDEEYMAEPRYYGYRRRSRHGRR